MRTVNKVKIFIGVLLLITLCIIGIVAYVVYYRDRGVIYVVRLPDNLSPDEYTVFLQTHFYTSIKDEPATDRTRLVIGNSTVRFLCLERTTKIVLHAYDLNISSPVVTNLHNNQTLTVYNIQEKKGQILEIQLNQDLEKGCNYSLFLEFRMELHEGHRGIFLSTYTEEKDDESLSGSERFMVFTNLQPSDARSVFPCFDEPAMKAVFHVTVIHRRNTTAIGNAPVRESSDIDEDWIVTRFHPTPKMSTYLFAIAVSEFTALTSEHPRVKIQIYARPSTTDAGDTALAVNVTGRILRLYEEYLGIQYSMSKLDQIAVPDLSAEAMENWGLVTYKESSMLHNQSTAFYEGVDVIHIIAHELAHQWFGNLVTMKWWNEIWLNEGFASFMTHVVVKQLVSPDFVDLMAIRQLHSAQLYDDLQTHPLSVPPEYIQTVDDLFSLFDTISYSKGSAVLRMLEGAVEEQVFLKGIKIYLNSFAYSNTDQYMLWNCIQQAVDESGGRVDVTEVMTTWTTQPGYPLLTINTTTGDVLQEQWSQSSTRSSQMWHVPVQVMTSSSGPSLVLLKNHSKVQSDELKSRNGEWILANVNYTGYYKVNYDLENWRRLLVQLETDLHRIPVLNRMGLIENAFEFTKMEMVDITLALNVTRFLRHERAFLPWIFLEDKLLNWNIMFDRSEFYGLIQAYWRTQVRGIYNMFRNYTDNLTIPQDLSQQYLQKIAVELACSSDLPECIELASRTLANWIASNNTIEENQLTEYLQFVILCKGMATAGQEEWDNVWNLTQSVNQTNHYKLLACTTNTTLLQRYLEYTLDQNKIPMAEAEIVVANIARNVAGHQLAWDFMRTHWEQFRDEWIGWSASMLIRSVADRFSTETELSELEALARNHDLGRDLDETIESIRRNIEWSRKHREVVHEWFQREALKSTEV